MAGTGAEKHAPPVTDVLGISTPPCEPHPPQPELFHRVVNTVSGVKLS